MIIQHKQTEKRGTFFVPGEDDDFLAELIYNKQQAGDMIIEHTRVDGALRGQSVGYQLVHSAVEYARSEGLKIIALCTFARAVIDRKPEFQDVLKA